MSVFQVMGLRAKDAPAFAPIDAIATDDGEVRFEGWCGMEGTTRTPQQALRFAAHVRQAALEAQRIAAVPRDGRAPLPGDEAKPMGVCRLCKGTGYRPGTARLCRRCEGQGVAA